jgi:hypothetical protein
MIELPGNAHFLEPVCITFESSAREKAYWVSGDSDNAGIIGDLKEILTDVVDNGGDDSVYCIGSRPAFMRGCEN